jgi:ribosomal protein S18 acetylase RimI-like enzyme
MRSDAITQFRLAGPGDARGIAEVHVRSWQSAYRGIISDDVLDRLSVDDFLARREEIFREATTIIWVVECDGRIVGFVDAATSRDADALPDATGELLSVYLLADFWERGVGRALYRRAFISLAERGYKAVTTWVLSDNARARAFYERIGMRPDGAEKQTHLGSHELSAIRYRAALDCGLE